MTIANGNIFYELGTRHAAKAKGCVLLAADWSARAFGRGGARASLDFTLHCNGKCLHSFFGNHSFGKRVAHHPTGRPALWRPCGR
jgi:hypothetical protein